MTDDALTEELITRFQRGDSAPFLFVGSGLSRRYLGLEDWSSLLEQYAPRCGHPFQYYLSRVNGDLPRAATLMAEDFHERWWSEDEFSGARSEIGAKCTSVSSPLKFVIASDLKERSDLDQVPEPLQEEVKALANAQIDGIVTTNWDSLLEQLFPKFAKYVGQNSAIFSDSMAVAEIFKIHGCCTQPNSLVLTAEDYEDFMRETSI